MDIKDLSDTVIKIGLCHCGSRQYHLFLCTNTFLPGTGDYEHLSAAIHAAENSIGFDRWIE